MAAVLKDGREGAAKNALENTRIFPLGDCAKMWRGSWVSMATAESRLGNGQCSAETFGATLVITKRCTA